MFQSDELKQFLETSHTVQTKSLVFAEWNLNQPENIARIGNYRYRPGSGSVQFATLPMTYDVNDEGGYYTGATDSDVTIDGGYDDNGDPVLFTTPKDKFKMLYSLEDCFLPFRPRSGINKPVYLGLSGSSAESAQYITNPSPFDETGTDVVNEGYIVNRPRYYLSSRYDQFKYWTSYRTEGGVEYGVSRVPINGRSYIYDAVPFVVYKSNLAANRIVMKMQTNVGDVNLGNMRTMDSTVSIPDPFYGYANQTTPVRWRVQVLKNNVWVDIISFNENSTRKDGSHIVGSDGHVELAYGLNLADQYAQYFVYAGEVTSESALPTSAPLGYAYLIRTSSSDRGQFAIWFNDQWEFFVPEYKWDVADSFVSKNSKFVSDVTDPDYFWEFGKKIYREIDLLSGIRVVVDTMNKPNCTFDLIELSPRLAADLSARTIDFSITKTLSDLGNGKIPVGSLLASTGNVNLNNDDFAFIDTNTFDESTSTGSLIANYLLTNVKFLFYEIVRNVNGYDYYIPMKTMYSEGFPQAQGNFDTVSLTLRDAFFILESSPAPSLLLTDISLSNAITVLLDYIGFSNFVFKRLQGQTDPIIPYFFIAPNQNVAEVINQLAVATQSAMFFDEYNNFVMMTKEYMLPDSGARTLDSTFYGNEVAKTYNNTALTALPNIIQISAANKSVNNNGQINYTQRYIQRSYGSTRQAMYNDEFKTWIYVPTLLWEVTGDQTTKAQNETATEQSAYVLTAMPLNSDLSSAVPTVVNNVMTNNIIDVGESTYDIARYNGYLYANGEIIKYDAVEYSISGQISPIWINSVDEYQKYFLKLPFNGKMYPTGNIRIWSEPEYITIDGNTIMKPGVAAKHGRGQFGTAITTHKAGLDPYWTDSANVYGCQMQASYLFTPSDYIVYPRDMVEGAAGINVSPTLTANTLARTSTRNGIIKNTLSQKYWTEKQISEFTVAQAGTTQSSALVFNGPTFSTSSPRDLISYVYKGFDVPQTGTDTSPTYNHYKHFGTRLRVIGKVESNSNKIQTPIGSTSYINIDPTDASQEINISGGSGGIGVMVDKETNCGYYFEIVALTSTNISSYQGSDIIQTSDYEITAGATITTANVVTIVTKKNHGMSVGEKIIISGLSQDYMNGSFTVTEVVSPTSLKYEVVSTFDIDKTSLASNVATLTTREGHNLYATQSVTISGIRMAYNVISKTISSNVVTLIFDKNHRFLSGDSVFISGVDQNGEAIFDGTYTLTAVSSNTISYAKTHADYAPTTCTGLAIGAAYDSVYNGTFTVTAVNGKTFSFSKTHTDISEDTLLVSGGKVVGSIAAATSTNAGTMTREVASSANISNVYFYKVVQGQQTFSIENNGVVAGSGIATVTTTLAHNFNENDEITMTGLTGTGSSLNNQPLTVIATPSSTTFTVACSETGTGGGQYGQVYTIDTEAIPYKLWSGLANILVDSGRFTGQYRTVGEDNTTVYDLAVEYQDTGSVRIFYLYINDKQVATVVDEKPLTKRNSLALFVRGSSRVMFENVYALSENYSQNTVATAVKNISEAFGTKEINSSEALRKYAVSGFVQAAYLSGISSYQPPEYNMYYDEFGTIMREAAHFNIKYDRAFPALYARLAPTMNRIKTYASSGFYAGAYGADFLIFNCTDNKINLDPTSGNFLRIQGITFTQNTTKTLTVDDYFNRVANLSDPQFDAGNLVYSPQHNKELYNEIKISRQRHGNQEFTIESPYIQSDDLADNMLGWIISKTMKPKKNVGLTTFATQMIQLGDLVNIHYKNPDGIDVITPDTTQFVVYNIEYKKSSTSTDTTIYLAEV